MGADPGRRRSGNRGTKWRRLLAVAAATSRDEAAGTIWPASFYRTFSRDDAGAEMTRKINPSLIFVTPPASGLQLTNILCIRCSD